MPHLNEQDLLVDGTVNVAETVQRTVQLTEVGHEEHEVAGRELSPSDAQRDDQRPDEETNSLVKNHSDQTQILVMIDSMK